MIVLLTCSINLYGSNDEHSSTGELESSDSVLVSYNDLRLVNSKLIELKYEKEKNVKLRSVIQTDSIIIANLEYQKEQAARINKTLRLQRNISIGVAGAFLITSIVLFIK